MLCNGVIVFDDGGELLPTAAPSPRAAPPWPVRWQWPPEVVMTLTMSWAKAQRAIGRPATTAHEAVQNAASFVRFNAAAVTHRLRHP
jgi:hypothetical protein